MAFEENSRSSLKHSTQGTFHPEALRAHTEQFGYGLSVHFVAKLLGISIDRFFFIDAAGSRPDFRVRISAAELASSSGGNVAALSPSGYQVQLEVKARTGWAKYRKGEKGLELLQNLSIKAASKPHFATISLVISLPSKDQTRETRARILVADPGDPQMLDTKAQLLLLLEETLRKANCRSKSLSRDIVIKPNTGLCKRFTQGGYSTAEYSAMSPCGLAMLANGACLKVRPDPGWPQMIWAASGSRGPMRHG
jgi:hypothetical protein